MFKRLFGQRGNESQKNPDALRMPEVEVLSNIEEVFDNARKAAAAEAWRPADQSGRYVVIVTPKRQLLFCPCPPQGSMPREEVADMEQLISPEVKKNIAVIAFNEISSPIDLESISEVIPFIGLLIGIAYIGHAVWVFEGHPSALAAGCRDADAVIVDSGMMPFLQKDWMDVVSEVMRNVAICVHDRTTYSLEILV